MPFEAFHSKYAHGRVYWLVVYLKKPATPLALSSTMLGRVQPSADDADIVVDLHTLDINVTTAARKVIRVTVHNLSFELDCTQGVKMVENPAMRFQLQVEIEERTKDEFAVEVTVGTDEDDTLAVREVMDLICERVDNIEMSYPADERERCDSHEHLKILALPPAWLDQYKITCQTTAQKEAVDTWYRLLVQKNMSRNEADNGWTIPLPLSDADCSTLQTGLSSGEIEITEKGTPAKICDRRGSRAWSVRQLRESIRED